jgi:hypothetical protein
MDSQIEQAITRLFNPPRDSTGRFIWIDDISEIDLDRPVDVLADTLGE